MFCDQLSHIVRRELTSLRGQIEAYPTEEMIWELPPGITNSAGTLTLHLVGNLRHYIGAMLGKSGYVRNRPAEFADRDVPRDELLRLINQAMEDTQTAFSTLADAQLDDQYPIPIGGVHMNIRDWMFQTLSHLAYHLGQIDYHRRILSGENHTVPAIRPADLPTAKPVED